MQTKYPVFKNKNKEKAMNQNVSMSLWEVLEVGKERKKCNFNLKNKRKRDRSVY